MSSTVDQLSLVLIRRLADGTNEWIDLEVPQRIPAAPGAAYALIDRTNYEAPQTLVVARQGEDLIVEVSDAQVLVLGGFFATLDAAFHPTTDVASGAGPFSGSPVTPDTPILATSEGKQVVWSAQPIDQTPPTATIDQPDAAGGSNTPMILGGLAAGGLGLALLGGGGGGGGGGSSLPADTTAPRVTSGPDAPAIDENSGSGQIVYTATATDASAISWSLAASGDSAAFTINPSTGAVSLVSNPDFESQASYAFTVVATDAAGNRSQQAVTLAINDLDETPPTITSGDTATAIDENSGAGQEVYTATGTDDGPVTWSLAATGNGAAFSIDADTGAVTLTNNPDFETQPSYAFTVIATDETGNSSQLAVSLAINNLDDSAPFITSGATADIDENVGTDQVVYTATATDDGTVTWNLTDTDDDAAFSIDANSGVVTLSDDPDFETQSSYTFTVVATDDIGNTSQQAVTLAINDIDENDPVITSENTATAIDENSGAGQEIYAATATDESPLAWSLATSGDAGAFSIDVDSGAVTLNDNPDFETQSSYDFTVVATDAAGNSSQQAVTLAIIDQDDSAPFINSGAIAAAIDENSGASQEIYTATAIDDGTVTWGLAATGDGPAFNIDSNSGAVTLTDDPDFEANPSYTFTVVATDDSGNSSQQAVSLAINDLDENAPNITSGGTATALDENSGTNQLVYTAAATDEGTVTWSLGNGGDNNAFNINAGSGAVTLTADPNFETNPSYTFTVVATDDSGNSSQQAVTLTINDLDENDPVITSGGTATALDENTGANQLVYTAAATDEGTVTWSLGNGGDNNAFNINTSNGQVRLSGDPDFETDPSYTFTVVATDDSGNSSQQAVTLTINDLDDDAPNITSGGTATALDENSGTNQLVYTAAATDASPFSWSLGSGNDNSAFNINAGSGAVTLIAEPNFETQSSYTFNIVATDAAGNSSQQAVTLAINDLDENAPNITSPSTADLDENGGTNQLAYTAAATDASPFSWSLGSGNDNSAFNINAGSGAVTLIAEPNFETQSSYTFNIVATDAAGNSSQQAVTLAINDLDENAPNITSPSTADVDENGGANQPVYIAAATDANPFSWSLGSGNDNSAFNINAGSGVVTLIAEPDFETQSSYTFNIVATDAAGNSSQQAVILTINDLDDTAPNITSPSTADVDENGGTNQPVYIAAATDANPFSWSLGSGNDNSAFNINAGSGVVTLIGEPDFETQSSYTFNIVATDAAGNSSQQAVILTINDLDDTAPNITSPSTADVDENGGTNQPVYIAAATDANPFSWSLGSGNDNSAFNINAGSGVVTLIAEPDFETQSSYTFNIVATDAAGNSSQQAVTLAINDLDENAPNITSPSTADVDENGGTNQLVYNAVATDASPFSWSLGSGNDNSAFNINAGSGAVTLIAEPDFETQSSYTFNIVATDAAANSSQQAVTLTINDLDDTAPTLDSSTPADEATAVLVGDNIVLNFSENVSAGNGNITISNGLDTRTINVNDGSQVSISGSQVTIDPALDLLPGSTYNVQIASSALTDAAGNNYLGISDTTTLNFDTETVAPLTFNIQSFGAPSADTSIVVFDLVDGMSSDHSARTFQSDVSYDIYIRVDSSSASLNTTPDLDAPGTWATWSGAGDLGSDDRIILVGNGTPVEGPGGGTVNQTAINPGSVAWQTATNADAGRVNDSAFARAAGGLTDSTNLFDAALPSAVFASTNVYLTDMPDGILTSQGLA